MGISGAGIHLDGGVPGFVGTIEQGVDALLRIINTPASDKVKLKALDVIQRMSSVNNVTIMNSQIDGGDKFTVHVPDKFNVVRDDDRITSEPSPSEI